MKNVYSTSPAQPVELKKAEILVVGSLAYDSISTPFGRRERTLGGSANYFSLAASLMSNVNVVGVVGRIIPIRISKFCVIGA